MDYLSLAWLFWDPERVLFTVPIIDRPIVWYGLWFVSGFIVGYLLILPMFRKKLERTPEILDRDIADWGRLIAVLQEGPTKPGSLLFKISQNFDKKTWQLLRQPMAQQKNSNAPALRSAILAALNSVLNDTHSSLKVDRAQLEALFPKAIYRLKDIALYLVDRLTWFVVAGTIIGARLGHVFFYDWPRYEDHYGDIFKVWEGGLASHGATVGILLALFLYQKVICRKFPELSFQTLLDIIVVPTAFAACCIRIGNFFNQEIIGTPTSVPWAVIFGHPADHSVPEPRHPVQLYEGGVYLLTFFLLYYLWKTQGEKLRTGVLSGIFFISIFGSRFFFEFLKMPQSLMLDESFLQTGQYLSIPCVALGLWLLSRGKTRNIPCGNSIS